MKKLVIFLKIFTVGAVFTVLPIWLAVSHIEMFIHIALGFVAAFGIFIIGAVITEYNKTISKWVIGKDGA